MECLSTVPVFQGSSQGPGFCLTRFRAVTEPVCFGCLGARRELGVFLQQWSASNHFMQKPGIARSDQEKVASLRFLPWEGKRRVRCPSNIPDFSGLLEGLVSVSRDPECWWNWHTLDAQGSQRTKESSVTPCSMREPSEPQSPEPARDYTFL